MSGNIVLPHLANATIFDPSTLDSLGENFGEWARLRELTLAIHFFPKANLINERLADHLLFRTADAIKRTREPTLSSLRIEADPPKDIRIVYESGTIDCALFIDGSKILLVKRATRSLSEFGEFCRFGQDLIASILSTADECEEIRAIRERTHRVDFRFKQLFRIGKTKDAPVQEANNAIPMLAFYGVKDRPTNLEQPLDICKLSYDRLFRNDITFSFECTFSEADGTQKGRELWLQVEAPWNEHRKTLSTEWCLRSLHTDVHPVDMWCDWSTPINKFWGDIVLGKILVTLFIVFRISNVIVTRAATASRTPRRRTGVCVASGRRAACCCGV